MAPEPVDKALYASVKARVVKANPTHSAYRSGTIVKQYKAAYLRKYGANRQPYTGAQGAGGLTRWFKEDWRNQRGGVGYKKPGDVYRPTKRVSSKTPATFGELSSASIRSAMAQKKSSGRVGSFAINRPT